MNRIRQLRNAQQMKQSDLALQLKVGQNTISNWENGKTEPDSASLQKMSAIFDCTIDYILGHSVLIKPQSSGVWIPVLGDVAAGVPIEAIENVVDYEEIDAALAATGEFFGLRIKGSSMEPRMQEGDVVIVRKQDDAETGQIAVISVNGDSATVKKIKKLPDELQLIPTNPSYDPLYYTAAEVESLPVRIIGRVVELRMKF